VNFSNKQYSNIDETKKLDDFSKRNSLNPGENIYKTDPLQQLESYIQNIKILCNEVDKVNFN